jgi:predicted Zn-ribbon and HTH transcriptional regulator
MVLVWIGIGIGILIAIILIVKAIKTSSQDVLRMDAYCRKCGLKTNGLKCPRCEKRNQSFGV